MDVTPGDHTANWPSSHTAQASEARGDGQGPCAQKTVFSVLHLILRICRIVYMILFA